MCAQFEALAGFSAVIDRLGEFAETVDALKEESVLPAEKKIELKSQNPPEKPEQPLLKVDNLTLLTPDTRSVLIEDLSFEVSSISLMRSRLIESLAPRYRKNDHY